MVERITILRLKSKIDLLEGTKGWLAEVSAKHPELIKGREDIFRSDIDSYIECFRVAAQSHVNGFFSALIDDEGQVAEVRINATRHGSLEIDASVWIAGTLATYHLIKGITEAADVVERLQKGARFINAKYQELASFVSKRRILKISEKTGEAPPPGYDQFVGDTVVDTGPLEAIREQEIPPNYILSAKSVQDIEDSLAELVRIRGLLGKNETDVAELRDLAQGAIRQRNAIDSQVRRLGKSRFFSTYSARAPVDKVISVASLVALILVISLTVFNMRRPEPVSTVSPLPAGLEEVIEESREMSAALIEELKETRTKSADLDRHLEDSRLLIEEVTELSNQTNLLLREVGEAVSENTGGSRR